MDNTNKINWTAVLMPHVAKLHT